MMEGSVRVALFDADASPIIDQDRAAIAVAHLAGTFEDNFAVDLEVAHRIVRRTRIVKRTVDGHDGSRIEGCLARAAQFSFEGGEGKAAFGFFLIDDKDIDKLFGIEDLFLPGEVVLVPFDAFGYFFLVPLGIDKGQRVVGLRSGTPGKEGEQGQRKSNSFFQHDVCFL